VSNKEECILHSSLRQEMDEVIRYFTLRGPFVEVLQVVSKVPPFLPHSLLRGGTCYIG
jgi:hypothetical protein